MRTPAILLVVLTAATAVGAPVASASGDDIIRDCIAATLKSHYPADDYRDALENMPSDVDEYSDCRAQILTAQQNDVNRPKASAARATTSPGGGSTAAAAGAPSAASASPEEATPTAAEPTATSPQTSVSEVDAGLPSEFGAYTVPVAGAPAAEPDQRAPLVPIVIAFAVIVATGARVLARWGGRAEPEATTTP